MSDQLNGIILEARQWVADQSFETLPLDEQATITRFQAFIDSVSATDAPPKLEAACWLMSRWITDQMDWSSECFQRISEFVSRLHLFAKEEAWRRFQRDRSA